MSISHIAALATLDPGMARDRLMAAIESAGGNRALAARALGLPLTTLYRWLRVLGVMVEVHRRWPPYSHRAKRDKVTQVSARFTTRLS